MIRLAVIASVGTLAGCAVADLRPGIVRHETPKQIWQKFHGPGVRIRAVMTTSSMIQPEVSLSDSAYLVIGDIGDDGTMRIIYPAHPGDENLVPKGRSFQGPRFQPRVEFPFRPTAVSMGRSMPGYTFAIASSLPLDLGKLAEGERWSIFDVYYDNHMSDPRPAITDLAAAIASDVGQVSISYAAYAYGFISTRGRDTRSSAPLTTRRRLPRPPR
jgi:hypothetical protein